MNDYELLNIQEKVMSSFDSELEVEDMITETAKDLASLLQFKDQVKFEFGDIPFTVGYKMAFLSGARTILMVFFRDGFDGEVADNGEQIRKKQYTATGIVTNDMSLKENLAAVAETFLRWLTGHDKASEIPDDGGF